MEQLSLFNLDEVLTAHQERLQKIRELSHRKQLVDRFRNNLIPGNYDYLIETIYLGDELGGICSSLCYQLKRYIEEGWEVDPTAKEICKKVCEKNFWGFFK